VRRLIQNDEALLTMSHRLATFIAAKCDPDADGTWPRADPLSFSLLLNLLEALQDAVRLVRVVCNREEGREGGWGGVDAPQPFMLSRG
jgi:hypothetical protein